MDKFVIKKPRLSESRPTRLPVSPSPPKSSHMIENENHDPGLVQVSVRNDEADEENANENVQVSDDEDEVVSERELSDSDLEPDIEVSKSKKKAYKQKYKPEWKEKFCWPWLENKAGNAYCTICKKSLHGGITHIKRHARSGFHIKRLKASGQTRKIKSMFIGSEKKLQTIELRLMMYITEHQVPFRHLEHLPQLLRLLCPESEAIRDLHCSRTKGTGLVVNVMAPESLHKICNDLKNHKFSLMIDETTDITTTKCLALVVRYYTEHGIQDRFLSLLEAKDCSANGLFDLIETFFDENLIPFDGMIGFAADNCSVMMGHKGGVQALLRRKVEGIFILGCICHSMHLCASAACLKLPSVIEDLARDIYSYFKNSSKRLLELEEFQTFLRMKPHKLLKVSQTRWLSLQSVVNRILEQWTALDLFFTRAALEDHLSSAKSILNALKNPIYKVYYIFLSYVLEIVNKINLLFQGERPILPNLLKVITKYFKLILCCFLKKEYVERMQISAINPSKATEYLPIEKMYFGAKVEMLLPTLDENDRKNFRLRALEFYITLCEEIKKRISFDNPVLKQLELMDPQNALSGDNGSIMPLVQYFPHIIKSDDYENLNTEWRLLPDYKDFLRHFTDMQDFWMDVGKIKMGNDPVFPYLFKFATAILSLPHSSAATERIFSNLNLMKTKLRNRLDVNTCNALLLTKELLDRKACYQWDPPKSIFKRMDNKRNDIEFDDETNN